MVNQKKKKKKVQQDRKHFLLFKSRNFKQPKLCLQQVHSSNNTMKITIYVCVMNSLCQENTTIFSINQWTFLGMCVSRTLYAKKTQPYLVSTSGHFLVFLTKTFRFKSSLSYGNYQIIGKKKQRKKKKITHYKKS